MGMETRALRRRAHAAGGGEEQLSGPDKSMREPRPSPDAPGSAVLVSALTNNNNTNNNNDNNVGDLGSGQVLGTRSPSALLKQQLTPETRRQVRRQALEQLPTFARPWKLWSLVYRCVNGRRKTSPLFSFIVFWFMMVLMSPYLITNQFAAYRGVTVFDPKTLFRLPDGSYLDHHIPFVEASILPYYSIFFFYALVPYAAPRTSRGRLEMLMFVQGIVLATLFACIFFALTPAHVNLRWQVEEGGGMDGIFGGFYRNFYKIDEPYNAWPSLHCAQSIIAGFAYVHWYCQSKLVLTLFIYATMINLILSTLTTKQHFIFDMLTGTTLGLVTYICIISPGIRVLDTLPDATIEDLIPRWPRLDVWWPPAPSARSPQLARKAAPSTNGLHTVHRLGHSHEHSQ